jgi:mono/diheme cytochrome c family protein
MSSLRRSLLSLRRSLLPLRSARVAAVALALSWAPLLHSSEAPPPPDPAAFRKATHALFEQTCSACHNAKDADGGFDVSRYESVETLRTDPERWQSILAKLRAGEMPPAGVEVPRAQIDGLIRFLDRELARADASARPDPGRVTLRRLNRAEYTNTIRDLLGVEFRADENFPVDDSGDGFDNIGDVLSVSPLLMEKYLSAAEHIAERAIASGPLPSPIKVEYSIKLQNLQRLNPSSVQLAHRIDYDADYDLLIGFTGQRPENAKAVRLGIWVDGKLLPTLRVETKPSGLVYFDPYSEQRVRLSLTEGDHTLRVGFLDDDFIETLPAEDLYRPKANKFISNVSFVGPFPSPHEKPSRKRLLSCDPNEDGCVRRVLSRLAQRAYRRAVSGAEVNELMKFVALARTDGKSAEQGLTLALQAMLVSPHFLFHVERGGFPADAGRVHRVTDVELASRLSYFLWSSMPDDELLGAALHGQLGAPAGLDRQVQRMLRDPKASALAENFAGQWLEIRNLDSIKPDPDKFPAWNPELRDAFRRETQLFFEWILQNNRPIGDFIDARYTFLNESLAGYYGIAGVRGPEFRRVALTTPERGGVLSQASVLAVSSYPTRTSVVLRGKYVLQNILGSPPPPPPPDVPALDERAVGTSASLRQQMEAHRNNPVCASCHARMDPLGFGLESYDAIGHWRSEEAGQPVDASGVLPSGETFHSPAELRRILERRLPDFARCLTEKLLTYALGRGLQTYDKPAVREIASRLAASGYGFQALVYGVVHSLPFRERHEEELAAVKMKFPED